jgi:hypothetical protein
LQAIRNNIEPELRKIGLTLINGLPIIPDSCPACFTAPSQREYMKQLLAREEQNNSHLFANLLHAMRPLMTELPDDIKK